jgi:hypothetical protein
VLARAGGEDEEEGGAEMDWDLERKALEDLRANPTAASFCVRPTDAETDEGNTSSGGTFSPNVRVSLAIFFLR